MYQAQSDPTDVGGKRIVAAIIDWGIWVVVYGILFSAMAESADVGGFVSCSDLDATFNQCVQLGDTIYVVEDSNATLLSLLQLAYMVGIFVIMRGLTAKTPGTIAMGLRCVDEQGNPPGAGQALLRSVAGVVDYIPCCFPLVGTITMFSSKGHRRVGDMAAKTFMIDAVAEGQPVIVPGVVNAAASPYAGAPAPPPGAPPGAMEWPMPGGMAPGAPASTPAGPPSATIAAPAGEAQWDPQRSAWIRWDPEGTRWLQWDQTTQQWNPIQ